MEKGRAMMKEIMRYGWWVNGAGWPREEEGQETMKSVMVYRLDTKTMGKEPVGIVLERRRTERENNAMGMLRLARKEFAETEEEGKSIVIGEYV